MVVIIFVICMRGHDVRLTWRVASAHALLLYLLPLLTAECGEVLIVVVGVDPCTTWRVLCSVDEELVGVFGVEGAYPALWERPLFILHRAPVLDWNAILRLAGNLKMCWTCWTGGRCSSL